MVPMCGSRFDSAAQDRVGRTGEPAIGRVPEDAGVVGLKDAHYISGKIEQGCGLASEVACFPETHCHTSHATTSGDWALTLPSDACVLWSCVYGADANLGRSGNLAQPQGHAPEVVVDCHREVAQKVHPQQATICIVTRQIAEEHWKIRQP